jgi:hypothetical protein
MTGPESSEQGAPKKSSSLHFIAMVVIVALLGSLVVVYAYLQANPTPASGTNPCVIAGQPAGMFLRIASDSGTTVAGAQVSATHKEANHYCNGVFYSGITTSTSFMTNGTTAWYSLDSTNAGTYSFVVEYSGNSYSFSAQMGPVSATCATLYMPSGHTNVTSFYLTTTCRD